MASRETKPKYQRLANRFREQILARELLPGDRLPSFAELRTHHGYTSITIEHAYRILEAEDLIERRGGSGVYVMQPAQRQRYKIGLLMRSDIHELSPSMHQIMEGIRDAGCECDVHVTLMKREDVNRDTSVDGILYNCNEFEAYSLGIPEDFPQAILFQHSNEMSAITIDDFNGSRLATSYLISQGHKRISCLMEEWMTISIQRRTGYQMALRDAGIEGEPAWMRLTAQRLPNEPHYYRNWGYEEMREWLQSGWQALGCTAIVAQNDEAAIGIIDALRKANLRIPQDVSVIGFDGVTFHDITYPQLTSMEAPFYEMGKEAIKVLLDQIDNGVNTPREVSFPVKLREGKTVAKVG